MTPENPPHESFILHAIRRLRRRLKPVVVKYFPALAKLYLQYRLRPIREKTPLMMAENADGKMDADPTSVLIITPPHTLFIAKRIAGPLQAYGFKTRISGTFDPADTCALYIVLCAQILERLPPAENTIIFQLEQSIHSRWFTPEYLDMLKACRFIMEYKIDNIEFLVGQGIERDRIFYLPLGGSLENTPEPAAKEYDFLFYGDSLSSERRRVFLQALAARYRVKICNDTFGDDVYALIRKSRCVVNIHYYEQALLETPRIFEVLSLGVPVLSESSSDVGQYPELADAVLFFSYGSVDDMLGKAALMLEKAGHYAQATTAAVKRSQQRFNFMLNRALAGMGVIEKSVLLEKPLYIGKNAAADNVVALSLPETTQRRLSCVNEKSLPPAFNLFDGFRFKPGWVACACGYKALAQHFLRADVALPTIFEDDAFLRAGDVSQYDLVKAYLKQRTAPWDLFVGTIADLHPDTRIIDVERWQEHTFLTIDKMTSMVFNIYNRSGLEHIARWNEHDDNVETNTIDRHLEAIGNLRVVVCLPFIAGHKEHLTSSIWGFQNTQYNDLFKASEEKLHSLLRTHENS